MNRLIFNYENCFDNLSGKETLVYFWNANEIEISQILKTGEVMNIAIKQLRIPGMRYNWDQPGIKD